MGYVSYVLFVAFIAAFYCDTVTAECPNGWTVFDDSCYLFSHELLTFADSQRLCQRHGAHLAHIETAAENTFLKSFVRDLKDAQHWIGLTDEVVEGIWTWVDTDTAATFTDWAPGEPNQGKFADCGILWLQGGYRWADNACTEKYQPLCERSIESEVGPIIG